MAEQAAAVKTTDAGTSRPVALVHSLE